MVELSENMRKFVAEVFPAVVGTRRKDGTVQMNPIWFEYADGYFWLNSWRGSDWLRHIERDGDVTLALIDPHNMFRYAQVQGRLVAATDAGGAEHIDQLSMRYTGQPYQSRMPGQQRVKIQIEPVRIPGSIDWQPPPTTETETEQA
jgi:PPOX class probable F420-dependent enzyme